MKARKFLLGLVASVMSLSIAPVAAAEVELSAGADLVSSYVWRGMYQGAGAAIQPGMGISVGGFSASAWGSSSLASITTFEGGEDLAPASKELDFTLAYDFDFGLSISATDYWWSGENCSYFGYDSHFYEVALSYTISEKFPLTIGVATMVGGADKDEVTGDQLYSTYLSLGYSFDVKGVGCDVFLGATPAAGMYSGYDDAGICSVGATFSYDLVKSDKFSLPIFVETSFSPIQDNAYIVAGFSFSL